MIPTKLYNQGLASRVRLKNELALDTQGVIGSDGKRKKAKTYANPAEKQRAYRLRREVDRGGLADLIAAIQHSFDRGRRSRFADDLPEEPHEAARELIRRLNGANLVPFPVEDDETKARRLAAAKERKRLRKAK